MSPPRVVLPSVLTGTPLGKRYPHGPCRKQWLFYFCFWWIYYLIFRGGGLFGFAGFILFVLISNLSHTIPTTSVSQSRREAALQSSLWRICSWKPLTKPISLLHQGHSGGRECSPPLKMPLPPADGSSPRSQVLCSLSDTLIVGANRHHCVSEDERRAVSVFHRQATRTIRLCLEFSVGKNIHVELCRLDPLHPSS